MRQLALLTLLVAARAVAGPLAGTIDDPGLRRKVTYVYVEKSLGTFPVPLEIVMVNQRGNTYVPHLSVVMAGQVLRFQSEDPELHNVNARLGRRMIFNNAVLPLTHFDKKFVEPGMVHLTCNVHKEMSAWVLVMQNPYYAKPDKDGHFLIENVPSGSYTLRLWGEDLSDEQLAKKYPVIVAPNAPPLKLAAK